jgi:hypothetical protein
MTTTTIENKYEKFNLINSVTDKLAEFVINDETTKEDFAEYVRTIGGNSIANTIPYIFERKLNSKTIPELYLEKNKKINKDEKKIINGFLNNISSVFEVKKISKNKFVLFNLVNEKIYNVISPIKMTAFRGLGIGYYIVARFFEYENENYMIEMIGVYPSSKKDMAYKYAITKIIQHPELVYTDNKEMEQKIKQKIEFSYNRFNELFEGDEITTSNKYADDLIEYLNGSITELDWKSKIENIEINEYFDVSTSTVSNIMENGGFAAYKKAFDVTLIVDKQWGFYAIPFYKTFCSLFEGKEIKNAEKMVDYFLTATAVPRNLLERIANKYPNFTDVINKIKNTTYTFEEILDKYKQPQSFASATVLEESSAFSKALDFIEEDEKPAVPKVGRNDPCPCGSGKKYKKCCMLKIK